MLKGQLFENERNLQTIKDNLQGIAVKCETMHYNKPLTPEELSKCKDDLSQIAITRAVYTDELERLKEEFKNKLKPLEMQFKETLSAIKTKSVPTEGELYLVADYESKMMGYYNEEGLLISSRHMLPEERRMMQLEAGDEFNNNIRLASNF